MRGRNMRGRGQRILEENLNIDDEINEPPGNVDFDENCGNIAARIQSSQVIVRNFIMHICTYYVRIMCILVFTINVHILQHIHLFASCVTKQTYELCDTNISKKI